MATLSVYHIGLPEIYNKGSWKRLCASAGLIDYFEEPQEKEITDV